MNRLEMKAGSDYVIVITPTNLTKEEARKLIAYFEFLEKISVKSSKE